MEINLYHYNHGSIEEFHQDEKDRFGQGLSDKEHKSQKELKEGITPKELKDSHPHTENENKKKGFKVNKGVILSILVNHSTAASKNGETMASRPNMFVSQFIHNQKFLNLKKKKR